MNNPKDKVSLMFLDARTREKVWQYLTDYGLPYPVNGMVSSMIVSDASRHSAMVPSSHVRKTGFPDDDYNITKAIAAVPVPIGAPLPETKKSSCTCTKPFGGPVIKCPHCRKTDPTGYRALICKNSLKDEPVKCADLDTSGYTEKPPTPTTEYRRWKCDNKGCFLLWPVVSSDEWETAYGVSDEKNVHCFCKGRLTVIACDRDGRELSPPAPDKPRYFKEKHHNGGCFIRRLHNGVVETRSNTHKGWAWIACADNPNAIMEPKYDRRNKVIEFPEGDINHELSGESNCR